MGARGSRAPGGPAGEGSPPARIGRGRLRRPGGAGAWWCAPTRPGWRCTGQRGYRRVCRRARVSATAGGATRRALGAVRRGNGALVSLLVWLAFGAVAVAPAAEDLTWQIALYAVLSLTVIRIVPVAIALAGARLGQATILLGGAGSASRLASVVFRPAGVGGSWAAHCRSCCRRDHDHGAASASIGARATAGPLATRYGQAARPFINALAGCPSTGMPERRLIRAQGQRTRPRSRAGRTGKCIDETGEQPGVAGGQRPGRAPCAMTLSRHRDRDHGRQHDRQCGCPVPPTPAGRTPPTPAREGRNQPPARSSPDRAGASQCDRHRHESVLP